MAHCQDFALEEKRPRNKLKEERGRKGREHKSPSSVDLDTLLFGAAANLPTSPFPASFFFCSFPFHPLFAGPQSITVEDEGKRVEKEGCSL